MKQFLYIKPLTIADAQALEAINTGIEDDYVDHIFNQLVSSDHHALLGLFKDHQMLAIEGYSLFGQGKFAMLGRLRNDRHHQVKGHATKLLQSIVDHFSKKSQRFPGSALIFSR